MIEDFHPGDAYALFGALISGLGLVCLAAALIASANGAKTVARLAGCLTSLAGYGALLCAWGMHGEIMDLRPVEVGDLLPRIAVSVGLVIAGIVAAIVLPRRSRAAPSVPGTGPEQASHAR